MNFYLKPHPIMAAWAPGFFFLTGALLRHYQWSYQQFVKYLPESQTKSFLVGLSMVVAAWILGQLLNAVRDVLEHALDRRWKVDWDFFFWAEPGEIETFEEQYYNSYIFCANIALGLLASIFLLELRGGYTPKVLAALAVLLAFFGSAAILRRGEIRDMLQRWSRRPHRGNGAAR